MFHNIKKLYCKDDGKNRYKIMIGWLKPRKIDLKELGRIIRESEHQWNFRCCQIAIVTANATTSSDDINDVLILKDILKPFKKILLKYRFQKSFD